MATWQEKFDELSTENGHQTGRWRSGERNHNELRAAIDALAAFTRQYEAAGEPDLNNEMP